MLSANVSKVAARIASLGCSPYDEPMVLHQHRCSVLALVNTNNGSHDGVRGEKGEGRCPPVRTPVGGPPWTTKDTVRAWRCPVGGCKSEVGACAVPGVTVRNDVPGTKHRVRANVTCVRETGCALPRQRGIELSETQGDSVWEFPPRTAGNARPAVSRGHGGEGAGRRAPKRRGAEPNGSG